MKNKAVELMIKAQLNSVDEIKVEFLYSVSNCETYKVVMWKDDVQTEYQLKVELDFISEDDYGQVGE